MTEGVEVDVVDCVGDEGADGLRWLEVVALDLIDCRVRWRRHLQFRKGATACSTILQPFLIGQTICFDNREEVEITEVGSWILCSSLQRADSSQLRLTCMRARSFRTTRPKGVLTGRLQACYTCTRKRCRETEGFHRTSVLFVDC